ADVRRRVAGERWLAVPRPPQARTGRLDSRRLENQRERPARQVLYADPPGPPRARARSRRVEAARGRHLAHGAPDRGLKMRDTRWVRRLALRVRTLLLRDRVE